MTREFRFRGKKDEDFVKKKEFTGEVGRHDMGVHLFEGIGTMTPVKGNINAAKYRDI